jgi:RsiW-degrading membrane proteinase PrsW (M82 family)
MTAMTAGAGLVLAVYGLRALQARPSKGMRLPPAGALVGILALLIAIGLGASTTRWLSALVVPPIVLTAAALPPLWAVSWFARQGAPELTWRRGLVALAGGATVGVFIALVLEILFPAIVLALVLDLGAVVLESVEHTLDALIGQEVAAALTSPGFLYLLIQLAVVAPLAEELAKPLATLPLARRLPPGGAFWVGAMAGAGFAAVENALYAGVVGRFWAGILVVRALSAAIHPLGAGLMALSWRGVLRREEGAWAKGVARAALATGVHAVWNASSLLVLTLAGAQFFGELPPQIDVLGLSTGGTTLAVLVVLGLAALWAGRTVADRLWADGAQAGPAEGSFVLSDRAAAIWALACLVAIVPAGIAGLQILMR